MIRPARLSLRVPSNALARLKSALSSGRSNWDALTTWSRPPVLTAAISNPPGPQPARKARRHCDGDSHPLPASRDLLEVDSSTALYRSCDAGRGGLVAELGCPHGRGPAR